MSLTTLSPGSRLRGLADEVRPLGAPVVVGAAGCVLLLVGSLAPGSPVVHSTESGWFFRIPWPPVSRELSILVSAAVFWAGAILLVRAWLGVMRRVRVGNVAPTAVVAVLALWCMPLAVAPPLLSRDPYSYAAQGEIYSQGFDPYHHSPRVLGGGEFLREVDPLWRTTVAPYGPLFMLAARTAVRITGHDLLWSVVLLKLAALAGVALMAAWVPRLARASGHDPSDALALALLNPITLVHLVGGAHNEAIMVGLLVVGLALAAEGRPLPGVALCVLAGAVKLPALAGVAFIAWYWAGGGAMSLRTRLRRIALCGVVAAITVGTLMFVAGTSWRWITVVGTPTLVQSYLSPVTTTGIGISNTLSFLGIPRDAFLTGWQLLFIAAALAISFRALVRVHHDGLARASGTALVAVAVLAPVLFPFYITWGLVLLAAAGLRGGARLVAVIASSLLAFALLPGGRDLIDAIVALGPWWVAGLAAGLAVLATPTPVRSR